MKKTDWARAGVAVALGAFFGSLVGIKISGVVTWWSVLVGFLIGGILGYVVMEYKRIGRAATTVNREVKSMWGDLKIEEKIGVIVFLCLFLIGMGLSIYVSTLFPYDMSLFTRAGAIVMSSFLGFLFVVIAGGISFMIGIITASVLEDISQWKKRISLVHNVSATRYVAGKFGKLAWQIPLGILYFFFVQVPDFFFVQVRIFGWQIIHFIAKKIIWRFLVLAHSMVGLMVGFDGALGAIAGIVLRNPFIGAAVGVGALVCSYLFGYRTVARAK